jgi:hypothetical protein
MRLNIKGASTTLETTARPHGAAVFLASGAASYVTGQQISR